MTTTMTEAQDATDGEVAETAGDAAPAPKKRSNLVPALVLAVGMVAAAFLLKPAPGGSAAEATTTTSAAGPVVELDPMTLNLRDGRFIRVGLAIELSESADAALFEEHGSPNLLKDLVIFQVSELSAEQVSTPEGLEEFKRTLSAGAKELYGADFHGLYLTDLVIQ